MNLELVDKIVNAVLYEGYLLYPYRQTAIKNQQRWNFGVLYPRGYNSDSEAASMQTECLVITSAESRLEVRVRFLQLLQRQIWVDSPSGAEPVISLEVDGKIVRSWQEAIEREVSAPVSTVRDLESQPCLRHFSLPAGWESEPLRAASGKVAGTIVRERESVAGSILLSITKLSGDLIKLTVKVQNDTEVSPDVNRDTALMRSTISTHTILAVENGEFVSQVDPPDAFRTAIASCQNVGTWPILVGTDDCRDMMLSSPIILYDHPQIAPESAGDLFDGTEIDEILSLRIMTLTDEEKREMRGADERAREILERTETLPVEHFMKMHGAVRGLKRMKAHR